MNQCTAYNYTNAIKKTTQKKNEKREPEIC